MSQVLITGATGLVGGHLLRLLIRDRHINYIAAPTRRPLLDITGVYNPHDPQLTDALAQVQDPIDIAFCCLGTTRREAGSKEAFVHADYTLVVDTALTAKKLGAKHFSVVSAHGANAGSPFFTTGEGQNGRGVNRAAMGAPDHRAAFHADGPPRRTAF